MSEEAGERETRKEEQFSSLFPFSSLDPDERKDGQDTREERAGERGYSLPKTMNEKKMQEVILIKRSSWQFIISRQSLLLFS